MQDSRTRLHTVDTLLARAGHPFGLGQAGTELPDARNMRKLTGSYSCEGSPLRPTKREAPQGDLRSTWLSVFRYSLKCF